MVFQCLALVVVCVPSKGNARLLAIVQSFVVRRASKLLLPGLFTTLSASLWSRFDLAGGAVCVDYLRIRCV